MADTIAPPPPAPPERPVYGEWNYLESSIGMRGQGKSTHQCLRALQLQRESGGAYVIGHSLGARLPRKLPAELGGHVLPIVYYPTIAKLEAGLRRKPNAWHILAPPIDLPDRESADDLIQFTIRLSAALRKAAWQRLHPFRIYDANKDATGMVGPPIILIIDEGIAVEAAGASRKDANRWFLEFLYSLRHFHIALLYAIQDASARSWRVLEQSTAIHVFAVRHAWALQSIQAGGASPEEIERIRRLRPHEHVTLAWEAPSTVEPPASMRDDK